MRVRVKNVLTKTLQPAINIQGREGTVVQVVGDGYNMVEFEVWISDKKKLQWYVHTDDLKHTHE